MTIAFPTRRSSARPDVGADRHGLADPGRGAVGDRLRNADVGLEHGEVGGRLGLGVRGLGAPGLGETGGGAGVDLAEPEVMADGQAAAVPVDGAVAHDGPGILDRKSVVEGKRVSVRVDLGGRRIIKKTTVTQHTYLYVSYRTSTTN